MIETSLLEVKKMVDFQYQAEKIIFFLFSVESPKTVS